MCYWQCAVVLCSCVELIWVRVVVTHENMHQRIMHPAGISLHNALHPNRDTLSQLESHFTMLFIHTETHIASWNPTPQCSSSIHGPCGETASTERSTSLHTHGQPWSCPWTAPGCSVLTPKWWSTHMCVDGVFHSMASSMAAQHSFHFVANFSNCFSKVPWGKDSNISVFTKQVEENLKRCFGKKVFFVL